MLDEFKRFLFRGNIVDLAVAVILGTAFAAVIKAFTDGVISPIIGLVAGQSFDSLVITLQDPSANDPGVVLSYGSAITAAINFVLVAAVIFFLVVKPMQAMQARRAAGDEPMEDTPAPSDETVLLTEIRDLLRSRAS
ncbi:MAG: large conductance mechanosensitive channel protein MscL [Acidimicrobiales bacterium]